MTDRKKSNPVLPVVLATVLVLGTIIGAKLFISGVIGVQRYKVASSSMVPTMRQGEGIIVDLKHYDDKGPQRGDVVVYQSPLHPDRDYVHRVIAVGGDTVAIKDKVLHINGDTVTESYAIHTDNAILKSKTVPRDNIGTVNVPAHNIFVMGDNRDHSYDSRYTGAIDETAVKGKVMFIYWSDDMTRISKTIK